MSYQNRLAQEKSPYLLQHADNPVDWYPWGEEAFDKAKKEDKPIFLSIGYSTCHWCHVMEHESFESPDIAALINQHFVPVKVDREERPDIDNIYMSAVMAMTGQGGWPLTVLLTPDKKPFFGGTYFPPQARWGSPGLVDIIRSVDDSWQNRREELLASSQTLAEMLKENASPKHDTVTLGTKTLDAAFNQFEQMYDPTFGGFGSAPKFPTSHNLSFLLRYWKRTSEAKALAMVEQTLRSMARGGMVDHLAGGFHRYATDREWQVPHFEKMLYDQAILARTYLEAYQITHDDFYADIARAIFDYCLRDMQSPDGGFYSAEDADSPDPEDLKVKKEGAFYVWKHAAIASVLSEEEARVFNFYYGIREGGNAKSDPHGEFAGKNIIFADKTTEEAAKQFSKTPSEIRAILKGARQKLLTVRNKKPRLHLDDKVLVDWNGLLIGSLSFGARVLNEPAYEKAAEKAADFILTRLMTKEGRLLHRFRDNDAGITATIEDYAFFINGLLDLYEASFNTEYLKQAVNLTETMLDRFWDDTDGGFFFTADDAEKLLYRQKEFYDGALPSGNSMAALALIRTARMTFNKEWERKAETLFNGFSAALASRPAGHAQMLIALDFAVGPSREIVFAADREDAVFQEMNGALYGRFIPNKVVLWRPAKDAQAEAAVKLSSFIKNQRPIGGRATAYVCEHHVCKLPVDNVQKFIGLLDHSQKESKVNE